MLQTMDQSSGSALGYKLSDKVTKADIGTFGPVAEALVTKYGGIDLLLDITDLHWEKLDALSSDLDLVQELKGKVVKMALVVDPKWSKELSKLATSLGAKEFKTFASVDDAWDWMKD